VLLRVVARILVDRQALPPKVTAIAADSTMILLRAGSPSVFDIHWPYGNGCLFTRPDVHDAVPGDQTVVACGVDVPCMLARRDEPMFVHAMCRRQRSARDRVTLRMRLDPWTFGCMRFGCRFAGQRNTRRRRGAAPVRRKPAPQTDRVMPGSFLVSTSRAAPLLRRFARFGRHGRTRSPM